MPIYEYHCDSCGHQIEVLQSIRESTLTDCPKCHKPALKKRVSAAGFRLAGSGWYETDFKSDNKRNVIDRTTDSKENKETKKKESREKAKPASDKSTSTAESKDTH